MKQNVVEISAAYGLRLDYGAGVVEVAPKILAGGPRHEAHAAAGRYADGVIVAVELAEESQRFPPAV